MTKLLKYLRFVFILGVYIFSINSNAALINRGNGMIYDTSSNLTWLQDANYIHTTGYGRDPEGDTHDVDEYGRPYDWFTAKSWAENLVHGGYDDWRLPSVDVVVREDDSFYLENSELLHLWENTLGNIPSSRWWDVHYGSGDSALTSTSANGVSFLNIQEGTYWTGARGFDCCHVAFSTLTGFHFGAGTEGQSYAWAVREGDVRQTPLNESSVFVLLSIGLILLVLRRKSAK